MVSPLYKRLYTIVKTDDIELNGAEKPPLASVQTAAWILMAVAMFLVLRLHLLSALLAGLLVYELVQAVARPIEKKLMSRGARVVALTALAILTIVLIIVAILGLLAFFKSDIGNLDVLIDKLQHIITDARTKLPPWIADDLPGSKEDLKLFASDWLGEHSKEMQHLGKEATHLFVRGLVGMVIGALVSLREGPPVRQMRPLAATLAVRVSRFANAFRQIVFAQVRISALNTVFTGIFLAVIFPLFGVHLPLTKTLIALTFLTGLLPVVGNLISNSVIFVVSLSISLYTGLAALLYLIAIHKLEYFLNARIVGVRIHARAWELLLAMILLEVAFGIAGLIAAPIYYAYLKNELSGAGLI
jgi:predicted PurR-regulated permease PerM